MVKEVSESRASEGSAPAESKKKKRKDKKKKLDSSSSTNAKIADVQFSFRNHRLIEALRKRGGLIASNKFKEVAEEDEKINKLFADFEDLTVPTSAFITFESDDAQIAALNIEGGEYLLGEPM